MANVKFYKGNSSNLPATGSDNYSLYFIEDTMSIYKSMGTGLPLAKMSDVILCTTLPTTGQLQGKIYLNITDYTLNAWNGTAWKQVGGNPQAITASSVDTLTNKTIDASTNTISNLDTVNFKSSAISTNIPDTGAVDTKFATEKSVADVRTNVKGYVDTKVADLVNSAPSTLDTLKELSDALGSDANFSTTITNNLGKKADKVVGAVANDIAILSADGNLVDSGKKLSEYATTTYADGVGTSTLASAKTYSDSNLVSAKSYTDSQISWIDLV